MASVTVTTRPNGHRWVQFQHGGKRHTLRLGDVSLPHANRHRSIIKLLCDGHPIDDMIREWLDGLTDRQRGVIERSKLIEGCARLSLADFLTTYVERRNVKQSTITCYQQTVTSLVQVFGDDTDIRRITAGDADDFRAWLERRYASATVAKRCKTARQMFGYAIRHNWLRKNPFEHLKGWNERNPERQQYVSVDLADKVIDKLDWTSGLAMTFARFSGLRCPSEIQCLQWEDFNWDAKTFRVRQPKLEHYRKYRTCPIFGSLAERLKKLTEPKSKGAVFPDPPGDGTVRQAILRSCKRIGVNVWPKPLHNLRLSCQTDLEEHFPTHVVCSWLGNSERIAREHYLVVTDSHINKAADL